MNGKITQAKIEKAAKERIKYEKENDPKTLKILEGLKAGKTHVEIAREVNLESTTVLYRKKKLIAERENNSRRNRCSNRSKKRKRKTRRSLKTKRKSHNY